MMVESNADLLAAAAQGDDEAWAVLVDQFSGLVWSVARGYRLGPASTDDVVQTVWLRLAEHCGRIREPDRLAGWLATTTRNEAVRAVKARQRISPLGDMSDFETATSASVDEDLIDAETLDEVLQAFSGLDEETQRFLRLLCADPPLDDKTISEITGRPVGSIGPTRARCLKKLRKLLPPSEADRPDEGDKS